MGSHRHLLFVFFTSIWCFSQSSFAQYVDPFAESKTLDKDSSVGKKVQSIKKYCARTAFHRGLISTVADDPIEDRFANRVTWTMDPYCGNLKGISHILHDSVNEVFFFKDGRPIMCVVSQIIDERCYTTTEYLASFFYANDLLIHAEYYNSKYKDTVLASHALEMQQLKPRNPVTRVENPYSKPFLKELKNWTGLYELKEDYLVADGDTIMFPPEVNCWDFYRYDEWDEDAEVVQITYKLYLTSINFTSISYELKIINRSTNVSEEYIGTADLTLTSFLKLASEQSSSTRYEAPVVSYIGHVSDNFIEIELSMPPGRAQFALFDCEKRVKRSLADSPVLEAPRR